MKRYPNFVDYLDKITLDYFVTSQGVLILDKNLAVNHEFFMKSHEVLLQINGQITKSSVNNQKLIAYVNDKPVAQLGINNSPFIWQFQLGKFITPKEHGLFNLRFSLKGSSSMIKATPPFLTHFSGQPRLLSVAEIKPYCKIRGDTTICTLKPQNNIDFVVLPILYYPMMLELTINGVLAHYYSIFSAGQTSSNLLLTGVKLPPGIESTIKFRFQGLTWANWISGITWIMFIILQCAIFYAKLRRQT
jgi:hypothetical protein